MFWFNFAICSCILTYFGQEKYNKYIRFSARALLVTLLAYIVAFYSPVAQDHIVYANRYSSGYYSILTSSLLDIKERIEIGFMLINNLGVVLHLGVPGYLFLIGLITNGLLVNLLYRFPSPIISIITLIVSSVLFQEMNLVRQSVAIGFVLLSISFINKRKLWGFLVCILLATSFHVTALLCAPLWFLTSIKTVHSYEIFRKVILLTWLFSLPFALGLFTLDISLIGELLADSIYSKYTEGGNQVGTTLAINYIYNLMVPLSLSIKDVKYRNYMTVFMFGIILLNFSMSIPNLYRFALYFSSLHFAVYSLIVSYKEEGTVSVISQIKLIYVLYTFGYILIYTNILSGNSALGKICYRLSEFFI